MTSVFVHNFDYPIWTLGDHFIHYSRYGSLKDHRNVRILSEGANNRTQIISNLIYTILLHDQLYISLDNFLFLTQVLGFINTVELLRNNIFKVIDDGNYLLVISREAENQGKAITITDLDSAVGRHSFFSQAERLFEDNLYNQHRKEKYSKEEINVLLTLVEANGIYKNDRELSKRMFDELKYDIGNKYLRTTLDIDSDNIEQIHDKDIFKILRLMNINRGLACAAELSISSINIDAIARQTLEAKLSPIILENMSLSTTDVFRELLIQKGVPDLGELFSKGVISIEDIIKLRDNTNGMLFRKWFHSKDYNKDDVTKELLNSAKTKSRKSELIIKHLRWLYPTVIGFFAPMTGIAVDYVDGIFLDKVLQGWSPSLFLDNSLRSNIDKRIEEAERYTRRSTISKRFPGIGRNDSCPCGSGKKFKKCCGK